MSAGWHAELSGWYNSKAIYDITTVQPGGALSMGVKKEVVKKKGSISLDVADLFWIDFFLHTDVYLNSYSPSRKVTLSFSYRFGKVISQSGIAPEEVNRVQK
ncbi:outer membrane beta-barrel protein [Chitinophaga sancti]|uniref:outer membrane beta-barrel protein n=1 Tax=Chitinophaga sancti TaxID=1004 RepID=UPI0009FA9C7E|nr:outer membrane beta-barrel protein [Chitinophaga sancti]WQD65957.1 outer membrane beta-barrel protein [Chitinophaga sancti]